MRHFLTLIRLPNLLIIAFTQYMLRWCLILPTLNYFKVNFDLELLPKHHMSEADFFLLVLSTVMIAAAGYIINDYFDVRIDEVNRPSENVVGKTIKRRVAMGAHMVINIIGAGLGIWLSWKYNQFKVGSFLFITAPALLWFYSTSLKRQFLIGNVVIALLSGLVPMLVLLFELPGVHHTVAETYPILIERKLFSLEAILNIGLAYALFAFLISLLREMIKDTEDYEGDLAYGCRTVPIVLGIAPTKWIMAGTAAAVMCMLGWIQLSMAQSTDWLSFTYLLALVQLPLAAIVWLTLKAAGKRDWRRLSMLIKVVMIAGISYLFIYAHGIKEITQAELAA
ncbi:MAG: geranylgeranylglycerol-phosphate geranylgeranyltransferase [Bacteroidia bacterium]|jgi:4-hydroxybenzoate polyprenyltransferase|nr:geranylgeranylglycerol-phosphate geranylgeranyltransferase [Bacteroidia bacterium]